MRKTFKNFLSLLLTLSMVFSMVGYVPVMAEDEVIYIDEREGSDEEPVDEGSLGVQYAVAMMSDEEITSETATTSWYDADAETLEISTADELMEFALITQGKHATIAKDNFKGKTVELTDDIELPENSYWYYRDTEGIVYADYRIVDFAGTFDGNEKTISNIKLLNEYDSGSSVGLCFFRA